MTIHGTKVSQGFERVNNKFLHVLRTNYGTLRGWVRSMLGQLEFVTGRLDPHLSPAALQVNRLVFV